MTEQGTPDPAAHQGPPDPTYPPGPPPGFDPGRQPGFPAGYFPPPPPAPGSAVTALILGITGLVMCGLLTSIPAILVGRNAVREIDASQGRLGGRSTAQAGYVLGIVGTVLWSLFVLVIVTWFALGLAFYNSVDCQFTNGSDSFRMSCD